MYLKAGASSVEPAAVVADGYLRMNIDKGTQSEGGASAQVLGNIANSSSDCANSKYEYKTLSNPSTRVEVTTVADGSLWLFVGTDSGFEGNTTLYYTYIGVTLDEKAA